MTLALAQEAAELLAELKFKGDVDGKRMKEFIVKGVQWECAAHHPHARTHTHTHATLPDMAHAAGNPCRGPFLCLNRHAHFPLA